MIKPVEPQSCREKDWQEYAQAMGRYSAWLAEQPQQAPVEQALPEPVQTPVAVEHAPAPPVAHPTPPAPVFDPATGEWKLP